MNMMRFASRRDSFGPGSDRRNVGFDQPSLIDATEMRLEPRLSELRVELLHHALSHRPPVRVEHHVMGDIVEDNRLVP
jgi:hypothetical protein